MTIRFVVTEHPAALTASLERHYERIRGRLEQVAGAPVAVARYTEPDLLDGASAVVLSGSFAPWADHASAALARFGDAVRAYEGPVLGICAGMQLQAMFAGGAVAHAPVVREQGFASVDVADEDGLFRGLPARISVYEHHGDEVVDVPSGFRVLASSASCAVEAIAAPARRWWGTQFHPEEFDDDHPAGEQILRNFFELARA